MHKLLVLGLSLYSTLVFGQSITWKNQKFEPKHVKASLVQLNGEEVLKVERDLTAIPFDANRLEATVDEPTYVKLSDTNFENGMIEVNVLSRIQNPSPFQFAQGFIGIAFRINENDSAFESIYLRPKVGRSDNQKARNHTVQYFSYPNYKFERLRKEFPEMYETSAPVNINEWINMRIEVQGEKASLYINHSEYSTFVVDKMKGNLTHGAIGLWVDIGTEGYFKDLKVTPYQNPVQETLKNWERAKAYTKEYLDAMPESKYAFKPTREMRSFAEQMLHLADANYSFGSSATGVQSPVSQGACEKATNKSKANVTKIVLESYDFIIDHINTMTLAQLDEHVLLFGQFKISRAAVLEKCFEHQTHHRGQTTVYLRLAGSSPPQEKLF